MSNRLTYKVIFASSCDANHTEKELEIRNDASVDNKNPSSSGVSHGRGWQSERFCDYPQHLILHLIDICEIKQIQILSHQSKIASKIEIWVANDARLTYKHALRITSQRDIKTSGIRDSNNNANNNNTNQYWKKIAWKRLGYLSLDKNERSNWKARELKSVYIDTKANFVKFALHESHINAINLFNQTGIVALNVLGRSLGIIAPNLAPNDTITDNNNSNNNNSNINNIETNQSRDNIENQGNNNNNGIGNIDNNVNNISSITGGLGAGNDDFYSKYDSKTADKLRELMRKKQIAVEMEDYDEAKRCKVSIENLKNVASELINLEKKKQIAVESEDYDEAKSLKLQIQRLRELSINPVNINNNINQQHQQQSTHRSHIIANNTPHNNQPYPNQPFANNNGYYNNNDNNINNQAQQPILPPHSRQLSNRSHISHHSHRSHISQHSQHNSQYNSRGNSHHSTPPQQGNINNPMSGGIGSNDYGNILDERAIRPMGNQQFSTMDINNPNPFGARGGGQHVNPYEEQPIIPPSGDPFERFKNAGEDDIPPPTNKRGSGISNNISNNNNNNNINDNNNEDDRYSDEFGEDKGGALNNGGSQKRGMSSNGGKIDNNGPPPLKASVRKDCEHLIDLLGESIVTMLYSPIWNHRNEGLSKILELLSPDAINSPINEKEDKRDIFKILCKLLNKIFSDKVAHVLITGIDVFNLLLETFENKVQIDDIIKYTHSLLITLVNTLGHSNTRMVDASGSMLITLAHHDNALVRAVYHELLKPMKRSLPKHLKGRGVVLLELMPQFQIPKGIQLSQFMTLVKTQLLNKNGDVRDIGVQLTTILYQLCGNQVLPFLDDLNDFVKETLNNALMEATGQANIVERAPKSQTEQQRPSKKMSNTRRSTNNNDTNNAQRNTRKNINNNNNKRSSINNNNKTRNSLNQQKTQQQKQRRSKTTQNGQKTTGASGPKSPGKRPNRTPRSPGINASGSGGGGGIGGGGNSVTLTSPTIGNGNGDEEYDDMCNFCGLRDKSFAINEENLDLHYWQSCPMLTSCKLCEQVIEIPTLHEHILTECEAAENNEKNEIKNRLSSLPENGNRCPLCLKDIQSGEEGWRQHLLKQPGCPKNERPLPQ